VHPDGDLIVTLDGGTGNAVFALAPDQPVTRWGRSLLVTPPTPVGAHGTPAIGAGDALTARIYVASSIGDLYAFNPDGGTAWTYPTSANLFVVGPAVTQVTVGSNVVDAILVPDGVSGTSQKIWRGISGSDVTSVDSDNRDFYAAPLILNGGVYFATQNSGGTTTHVTGHSISTDGGVGPATTSSANGGAPWFGLVTDGTNLYAATRNPPSGAGLLVGMDTSFNTLGTWADSSLASGLAGEPTFGIDGKLYGADQANGLWTFDPATGAAAPFATLTSVGLTPLQGSDGHIYIPRRGSGFSAYEGNQLSWTFTAPAALLRFATMDCQGRLFVAHGATVSAFVSDDRGLADTPWPSLRRDARNTGNAGASKYGIRTAAGCTQ